MDQVSVMDQAAGESWQLYNDDCVNVLRGMPSNSVGYSLFSPPFCSLYVFSDDARDLSNCRNDADFFAQFRFVLSELFRVLKPGRQLSFHAMDLPTSITRDGFIGMRAFPDDIRRLCEDVGYILHSRTIIRKDPVSAMQRTKAIGLLHKQIVKDSALSRMAICDQIITMRKPGENDDPVSGIFETYYGDDMTDEQLTAHANANWESSGNRTREENKSIHIWQRYAEPVWMDIAQSDVLTHRVARAEHDERHISPLQLTPIRRCLDLWTNPGDVVFSPFTGIGSVGYIAIEMDRKFCGAELKASYYRQAVANLRTAERQKNAGTLFDVFGDDQGVEPFPEPAIGLFGQA